MKRMGVPETSHDAPPSTLPGAPLDAERAEAANPPAVPAKFWKGVAFGLCLTFAIAYCVYRLL